MYSFINKAQEFSFTFEETPIDASAYVQPEFKFCDSEITPGFFGDIYRQKVSCDQESVRNNKSTHEHTMSEKASNESPFADLAPITVSFINSQPDLVELEKIVFSQISEKGYNSVVLDCLDIFEEDEDEEEDQYIIRKKQKKSRSQIRALKMELKSRPNWNKRSMKKLAKDLGLTSAQVYKWHWDQMKKAGKSASSNLNNKRFKSSE